MLRIRLTSGGHLSAESYGDSLHCEADAVAIIEVSEEICEIRDQP